MKDIPMFTTENGVASLFFKELPYCGIARVKVRSSQCPQALLEECIDFCRACGAEQVHASGDGCLDNYQPVVSIWEMVADYEGLGQSDAMLFPVNDSTMEQWRTLANNAMKGVDNAAFITTQDCKEMVQEGSGYFIHRNGELLGIGRVEDAGIALLASVVKGGGADVVRALAAVVPSDEIHVYVASTNTRAIRLYERLGFVRVKELEKWYKIY